MFELSKRDQNNASFSILDRNGADNVEDENRARNCKRPVSHKIR